jgi:hypothetical protein
VDAWYAADGSPPHPTLAQCGSWCARVGCYSHLAPDLPPGSTALPPTWATCWS